MKIKNLPKTILSLTVGTAALSACTNRNNESKVQSPNIILIISDDMGYSDIGCFGGEIKTPNLDHLAASGLRYTQLYNSARSCPTRASLLTGLHPHQAGIGHMMENRGNEAYQGNLNNNCVTIAQVLKTAGYSTYMAGKWHVTPLFPSRENPDRKNWPLQRGFDHFFGTIHGAGSFYDPNTLTSGNKFISPGDNFYYTDAISDVVVKYIKGHQSDNPYFIYIAYTAAHRPLHALEKDIEKYKGVYDAGWDAIREKRYEHMLEMDLIDSLWSLSPANPDTPWESEKNRTLFWEHEGNRAIRKGKWKLVSEAWPVPVTMDSIEVFPVKLWELYYLQNDRTELNNLAGEYPEKVREMAEEWQIWAIRVHAVPKPPRKLRIDNYTRNVLLTRIKE